LATHSTLNMDERLTIRKLTEELKTFTTRDIVHRTNFNILKVRGYLRYLAENGYIKKIDRKRRGTGYIITYTFVRQMVFGRRLSW
jgi:ribosomal protein S25